MNANDKKLLEDGKILPLMEEFYTIQGEGFHSGKAAYFIRIGGCDVGCHWCDIKESWDANLHPLTNADVIAANASAFPSKDIVITGGEPLTYNLKYLTSLLKSKGMNTHLETSGTFRLSGLWDWICLSPKKRSAAIDEIYTVANELKVIVHNKDDFEFAEEQAKKVNADCYLFLQPEWSKAEKMMPLIVEFVQQHPKWNVSLQTHKYMRIP